MSPVTFRSPIDLTNTPSSLRKRRDLLNFQWRHQKSDLAGSKELNPLILQYSMSNLTVAVLSNFFKVNPRLGRGTPKVWFKVCFYQNNGVKWIHFQSTKQLSVFSNQEWRWAHSLLATLIKKYWEVEQETDFRSSKKTVLRFTLIVFILAALCFNISGRVLPSSHRGSGRCRVQGNQPVISGISPPLTRFFKFWPRVMIKSCVIIEKVYKKNSNIKEEKWATNQIELYHTD